MDKFYLSQCVVTQLSATRTRYAISTNDRIKFYTRDTSKLKGHDKYKLLRHLVSRANLVYPRDIHHYENTFKPFKSTIWAIDRRAY